MEHDRSPRYLSLRLVNVEFVLTRGLPTRGRRLSGFSGNNLNTVGNDEGGIKTNTKLTNQLTVFLLITTELLHECSGSRLRNRTEVIDDIVSRHTNTVIANRQGLARFIDIDTNFITLATDVKSTIFDSCKPPFINGIRRVRSKLSKENFAVGIKRVNHQLKQSFCFGLKSHSLLRRHCKLLSFRHEHQMG